MLMFVTWLVVFGAAVSWRFGGAGWALQVLFAGVACLLLAARSWFSVARRARPSPSRVALIDLQAQRIELIDEYVRERLVAGDTMDEIAASPGWFQHEEDARGRLG